MREIETRIEQRERLFEAIERAGLTHTKLAILMMYIAGWDQGTIGKVMGLDRRTVNYHWRDAVERLEALTGKQT